MKLFVVFLLAFSSYTGASVETEILERHEHLLRVGVPPSLVHPALTPPPPPSTIATSVTPTHIRAGVEYTPEAERIILQHFIDEEHCQLFRDAVDETIRLSGDRASPYPALSHVMDAIGIPELMAAAESATIASEPQRVIDLLQRATRSWAAVRRRIARAAIASFSLDPTTNISFSLSHLTVRRERPVDAPPKWEHQQGLSHGMHTDNCRLVYGEDGTEEACLRTPEHCCHTRDFSAILYLTDGPGHNYTGGDLIFADIPIPASPTSPRTPILTTVTPSCGTLALFTSGVANFHGVTNVEGGGRRFAMAEWMSVGGGRTGVMGEDDWFGPKWRQIVASVAEDEASERTQGDEARTEL